MLKVLDDDESRAQVSPIDDIVRDGELRMLKVALEAEVEAYVSSFADERDENGHRLVVRNGHGKQWSVTTVAGELSLRAPRVDDRRVDEEGERQRFSSAILLPWCRKSPKVVEVLPLMYLHGMSTGDLVHRSCGLTFGVSPSLPSTASWSREPTDRRGSPRSFVSKSIHNY